MIGYFDQFAALGCTVVLQEQVNSLQLLKESTVFITDYHPLAFDFSFLTKPVCFYQPDVEGPDNESTQSVSDLYSNELPGEIASNEDDLIYLFNQLGQNEFKMSHKNRQKADALLEYRDIHSSQLIYDAVSDLLTKK
jgi:CDP-glycerol glycerophosphotransferase